MNKIVLTGGGTAGHVVPALALLPALRQAGFSVEYIGSKNGMEKQLVEKARLPYHGIAAGKLRRYLDVKNITDSIQVMKGFGEAVAVLRRIRPQVIFSKGGFVTVPVVAAGWMLGIPVVIHESDMTPGLANQLAMPFAKAVCASFPETLPHISKSRGVLTGTPIRREILDGSRLDGLFICGFTPDKPVILVMGGSQGSALINSALRGALSQLLHQYQIIHLCGADNLDSSLAHMEGYRQFEYVSEEMAAFLTAADVIVSRAGANSISEFLALQKPSLLIPLSKRASRGDQILNAESFVRQGYARSLSEEELTDVRLMAEIDELYRNRENHIQAMKGSRAADGVEGILRVILKLVD